MIRMIQSTSGAHAKSYFSEALSKADYYIEDQELGGRFKGELAKRLGLNEVATKEVFHKLCDNLDPTTGNRITAHTKEQRTVGYDINFHCPKSVSLVHALSSDEHILKAFQKSVTETMKDIEADSMTRVRKDGKSEDRHTGELVYGEFIHQTSRPTEDHAPDPHLHAHCFVFNVTFDKVENMYKAGQFRDIKRDMPYYQARFHKRLADELIRLGYRVRLTDKSFEIEGVPEKVIELFSKRTDEIGRIAKEKGITGAKQLDALGARTRAKKDKGLTMSELKADWKRQIKELEQGKEDDGGVLRDIGRELKPRFTAKQCLDYAVKHSFERASVMSERRVLEQAFRYGLGDATVSLEAIQKAYKEDSSIIHLKEGGRTMCTTKSVLIEEKQMVELAKSGQGALSPLYFDAPEIALEGQQKEAVAHVLTTSNQVSIIRGAAGAGKTTLMKEAVRLMEEKGKQVTVIAPTSQASRVVLKSEGFDKAETVAKFLLDAKAQEAIKDQILWVDEAGLLGTQDMVKILKVAKEKNAKVILGGDTRQHASVVRGDALRILNTVGGIRSAEVNRIFRQRQKEYRYAVNQLSKGDVREAFDELDKIGFIKQCDPLELNHKLVEEYHKAFKEGKSILVISPTHEQGEVVTDAIRKKLRQEKRLGRKELTVSKLSSLNYTEAQKSDKRNYSKDQILQFNLNTTGAKIGSKWKVIEDGLGQIKMQNDQGEIRDIPISQPKNFEVYQQKTIQLAKGDKVSITKNAFDKEENRLHNGASLEVVSVRKSGDILLKQPDSGKKYRLTKDFGHLQHGYCVTSYASQGKTVDEVFIAQPAGTFSATDAKQFYVSVSRARDKAHIYTDDKEGLLEYASEIGNRTSAMELLDKHGEEVDRLRKLEILRDIDKRLQKELEAQQKPSNGLTYEP